MKTIKVKFTGGLLNEKDSIAIDGQEIPGIQKIKFSAAYDAAPRLEIFTIMPEAELEIEAGRTILHQMKTGGVILDEYELIVDENDRLRGRVGYLEDKLRKKNEDGK